MSSSVSTKEKYALAELEKEFERRRTINPYKFFTPNPKQELFLNSLAQERWFIGANKSGKTTIGAYEDLRQALGDGQRSVPNKGWVVTETNELIREIAIPKIFDLLPRDSYHPQKGWSEVHKKLTLNNGSVILFKSYEQGRKRFQSDSLDWIHLDEEPPEDIYIECKARLIDKKGIMWSTMTPLMGFTWAYHDIYLPWEKGEFDEAQLFLVTATLRDNLGFGIDEEGLARAETLFKGKDLLIRVGGSWLDIGAQMLFDSDSFQYYELDELEGRKLIDVGFCDPAFKERDTSITRKKREPDDTCIISMKWDVEAEIAFVTETLFFKKNPSVTARTMLDRFLYHHWKRFGMEENNAIAMRHLIEEVRNLDPAYKDQAILAHFYIQPVYHHSDKIFRLNSNLVAPVVDGRIRFHKSQEKLIKQLAIFPLRPPDDGPDCLEGAWMIAKQGLAAGFSTGKLKDQRSGRRGSRVFGDRTRATSSAISGRNRDSRKRLFR